MAVIFEKWGIKRAKLKVDVAPNAEPPRRAYLEKSVMERIGVKPGDIVVVTAPGFLTYAHYCRAVAEVAPPEYEGKGVVLLSPDKFKELGMKKGSEVVVWKHGRWS